MTDAGEALRFSGIVFLNIEMNRDGLKERFRLFSFSKYTFYKQCACTIWGNRDIIAEK